MQQFIRERIWFCELYRIQKIAKPQWVRNGTAQT
nr:MAG TPA: hypothetical protein [Caudoviricetes sp.]